MSIKARIEAIIYAAEEPVTFEQIFALVKEQARQELARLRALTVDVAPASSPAPGPSAHAGFACDGVGVAGASSPAPIAADEGSGGVDAGATDAVIADAEAKTAARAALDELIADYASPERGLEIRQVAGGFRMATKPEQHDAVRAFVKSLKPPMRLSLPALETLAVIAYKQPLTAPEISEIRGVDCAGVLGTLLDRKLITTAGRKAVIGRPILYRTTREFLLRFGLNDVHELPSMEEFEKLAAESMGASLFATEQPAPAPSSVQATLETGTNATETAETDTDVPSAKAGNSLREPE